jgi:hypothetical protein
MKTFLSPLSSLRLSSIRTICLNRWIVTKLILALYFSGTSIRVVAQQPDTVRTEYNQVVDSTSRQVLDNKGKYRFNKLMRTSHAEKTLIKVGYWGIPPILNSFEPTIEHKLATSWSIGGGASITHIWLPRFSRGVGVGTKVYGRYYYNMKRRIRQGRSADNLIGSYLELSSGKGIFGKATLFRGNTIDVQEKEKVKVLVPDLILSWGNQKRLGRFGYFDMALALVYAFGPHPEPSSVSIGRLSLGCTAVIGLGL